jgi:hypothetical protein
MKKNLLSVFFLICVSGISFSQTRFINPTGSDIDNNCAEPGNPCATINQAVSQAIAGDTIILQTGTYLFDATQLVNKSVYIKGDSLTNKPIITTTASDVIQVSDTIVSIVGVEIHMGLSSTTGLRGIVTSGSFNGMKISDVEIYSIRPFLTGMVFGAYGILANGSTGNSITVENSIIAPLDSLRDGHGRGIGLGTANVSGAGGVINNNEITAFYPIQTSGATSNLSITNNLFIGGVLIGYPNSISVNIQNNTFDAVNENLANNLTSLLEIRGVNNNSSVLVQGNDFLNYKYTGLQSSASRNVIVTNNQFTPLPTAGSFASIYANSKLATSGVQSTNYQNSIVIKGNNFEAGFPNNGTAILFANHFGANPISFQDTIYVGGMAEEDKNTFSTDLLNYITLDSASGPSSANSLWAPYENTIMMPFSQNVVAYTWFNNYNITDLDSIEAKMTDSLDINGLGDVVIFDPILTSIKNTVNNNISVFPNPANDFISINGKELSGISLINVFDVVGKNVLSVQVNNSQPQVLIPINKLSNGTYILNIENNGTRKFAKFIKE